MRIITFAIAMLIFQPSFEAFALEVGQKAPEFTTKTDSGKKFELKKNQNKHWTVLYFYPKAGTPGCTKQACAFRDAIKVIEAKNSKVYGVSTDSVAALADFKKEHRLSFELLSDEEGEICSAYGTKILGLSFSKRYTFIIDPSLIVRHIDTDVDPAMDAQKVADLLTKLQNGDSPQIKLHALQCGENQVNDISIFSPGANQGVAKTLVVSCFVIHHPKGIMVWDTGLSDSLAAKKEGVSIRDGAFTLRVKKPFAQSLSELKIDTRKVEYVGISHMHPDHVGNLNLFENATILLQKEEFDAAFSPSAAKHSFDSKLYPPSSAQKYRTVSDNYDVFGDGSVMIISTPGHTPGHQSLMIKLPKTGPIVLSGDLYHFSKNREFKRVPSFNFNKELTIASMNKLESLLLEHKAQLWIQHDPEQMMSIYDKKVYE